MPVSSITGRATCNALKWYMHKCCALLSGAIHKWRPDWGHPYVPILRSYGCVMGPQKEKMHPYGWKVSSLREEKSQANFPFLEATFPFLDLDCPTSLRSVRQLSDLGKKSSPLGMKSLPSIFPLSEHSLSSHREHIFWSNFFSSFIYAATGVI